MIGVKRREPGSGNIALVRQAKETAVFAERHCIRRLAARVLVAWLLALATGIVNACVIMPGAHELVPGHALGATQHTAVEHNAAGCHGCEDDDAAQAMPGGCAKFCADESSSVPAAKQVFDPWQSLDVALVPTMALAVAGPAHGLAACADGVVLPQPLCVPIAYLRLTL